MFSIKFTLSANSTDHNSRRGNILSLLSINGYESNTSYLIFISEQEKYKIPLCMHFLARTLKHNESCKRVMLENDTSTRLKNQKICFILKSD